MLPHAFPVSPAAANATEHACSRHPDLLGPRFCSECRGPLCTACARHRPHRTCPSCNLAAGRKASAPDVGWFAMLCVDGFLHALATVKTRVLPFAVLSTMMALAGFVSMMLALEGFDGVGAPGADQSEMMTAALALSALSLVVLLGFWAQPALSLPTVARISFGRRLLRSVIGAALPSLAAFALMGLGAGLVALGDVVDSDVLTVLGALGGGLVLFLSFALSSTALPIQAAYALRGRKALAALKTPFAGGGTSLLMTTLTWLMLLSMLYSSTYAALMPLVLLGVFSPWASAVVGVPLGIVGISLFLVIMAAYASASLRIAEDRARRE